MHSTPIHTLSAYVRLQLSNKHYVASGAPALLEEVLVQYGLAASGQVLNGEAAYDAVQQLMLELEDML